MAYDLTKYKLQPGQRVEIVYIDGSPRGGSITCKFEGQLVAEWDFGKGNTGTIARVENYGRRGNSPPWIIVTPDPAFGFGDHTFTVKEVRKLEGGQ